MIDPRAYIRALFSAGLAWMMAAAWPLFMLVTLPATVDALPDNSGGGQTILTVTWAVFLVVLFLFLRKAHRLARMKLRESSN